MSASKIKGTHGINRCYDCEHCKDRWYESTFESPYGTEYSAHGHSYCDIDEDLEISGLIIPVYCPLYGTKKKPARKPNRIIRWYNNKTSEEISRDRNGLEKIKFIQDEPGGRTFTVTIDELEKLLVDHFGGI